MVPPYTAEFEAQYAASNICKNAVMRKRGGLINITGVTHYLNILPKCSPDSYYQCIANKFTKIKFSEAAIMKSNGSKCEFNQICTPFSLPVQENIPVCGNEFDRVCHLELLTELMTMLQKDCKKLCHIK